MKNRGQLTEKLGSHGGAKAASCALALSYLPKDAATIKALETAVREGDDLVAFYSAWAMRRMGERAWADAGVWRLGRFEFVYGKILFGRELAWAGKFDGWMDVERAIRESQSSDAEFGAAITSVWEYSGMKDGGGKPINIAAVLKEILNSEGANMKDSRRAKIRLLIQSLEARKQP